MSFEPALDQIDALKSYVETTSVTMDSTNNFRLKFRISQLMLNT